MRSRLPGSLPPALPPPPPPLALPPALPPAPLLRPGRWRYSLINARGAVRVELWSLRRSRGGSQVGERAAQQGTSGMRVSLQQHAGLAGPGRLLAGTQHSACTHAQPMRTCTTHAHMRSPCQAPSPLCRPRAAARARPPPHQQTARMQTACPAACCTPPPRQTCSKARQARAAVQQPLDSQNACMRGAARRAQHPPGMHHRHSLCASNSLHEEILFRAR